MELEGEMPLEGRWVNLVVGLDRTLENLDLERLQHYILRVDSQHDPLVLHTSNWCYVNGGAKFDSISSRAVGLPRP